MARTVAVIGAGPAGLMAAECLSREGVAVTLYERMPSPGRKFLLAGRGGLNLTHSEPLEKFLPRYAEAAGTLTPAIQAFPPDRLREWAEGLGQELFVGSSGRVFPRALKASPLLRAWLARLARQGVELRTRQDWRGWNAAGELVFADGVVRADATVLALGGASWPRLGATGDWAGILAARGVGVAPLRPANCGFTIAWSEHFRTRFAGQPLKPLSLTFAGRTTRGEAMVSAYGIEGGVIYARAAELREAIAAAGEVVISIDLRPDLSEADLTRRLAQARQRETLSNVLRKAANLSPVSVNLLRESVGPWLPRAPAELAALIKSARLTLLATQPLARAISTAGGIALAGLNEHYMLKKLPGVFAAGEMLDWEAPTGGYLLQASIATGRAAAQGALRWLAQRGFQRKPPTILTMPTTPAV